MSAALKLDLAPEQLSEKPRLGKKVTRPRLVWENPALTGETQKGKLKAKPDSSYGRVLYNYFRYYDPETDRYLTADPIGLAGGINPYLYANANPAGNIDPYGLATIFVWGAGPGSKYGHTSVFSNSGSFLSHHPLKSINPDVAKSFFRTYAQDRALYGREPDFAIYIDLPDELAADQFINNYKRNEDFWGVYGNCADGVSDTLNAGHLGLDSLNTGLLDFITYPSEIENALRGVYWRNNNILRDVARP